MNTYKIVLSDGNEFEIKAYGWHSACSKAVEIIDRDYTGSEMISVSLVFD